MTLPTLPLPKTLPLRSRFWQHCMHTHIHVCICTHTHLYMYVYVYVYIHIHTSLSLSLYIYIYICMYVCVHTHIFIYFTQTQTHIFKGKKSLYLIFLRKKSKYTLVCPEWTQKLFHMQPMQFCIKKELFLLITVIPIFF
jgi:hypothetical protein